MGEIEKQAFECYQNSDLGKTIYEKVAELDFPLIINTNPDVILNDLLKGKCESGFYDLSNSDSNFKPSSKKPKTILYNIFGSFANPFSIIFTEKEAVEFTKRVYEQTPPIPEVIKDIIRKKYGIFIGFDFKEWHLKILFNVLDLKNKPGNYSLSDTNSVIMEHNKEYFERQYNMTFIKNDVFSLFRLLK